MLMTTTMEREEAGKRREKGKEEEKVEEEREINKRESSMPSPGNT